ncbi:MAG: methionyl-tRNA formyltransferase [Clostridia bacterium]|jgi:methionyl-tRNA formyltransferase|nr:methionyl-tRNA formyltransferase [Clostridia bacterium]MCI2013837.1 methionyl-tRNA formyltransferase [Clostridia bacterium]
MKVVFMGTPEFADVTLRELIKFHNVCAVVTQIDKPKGRGKKIVPPIVKKTAIEFGIPVLQPKSAKDDDFADELEKFGADIFIVAAYGQILPERILNMPKHGCINIHGSLLPLLRGASPIQTSIIDGFEKTGVTIMYMAKGLDSGDIISKKEVIIENNDTYGTLGGKLAHAGANLLIDTLKNIENGSAKREKQNESKATFCHVLDKSIGHINWNKSAFEINCLQRGLTPQMGAYCYYNDDMLKIWNTEVSDKEYNVENGTIAEILKKGFAVQCGKGSLRVLSVQAKGGKIMDTDAYMRGHSIEKSMILK